MAKFNNPRNPRRVNAQGLLHIDYTDENGVDQMIAADHGPHFDLAESGQFGSIAPYVPPPPPTRAEKIAARKSAIGDLTDRLLDGQFADQLNSVLIQEVVKTLLTGDKAFWVDPQGGGPLANKAGYKRLLESILEQLVPPA